MCSVDVGGAGARAGAANCREGHYHSYHTRADTSDGWGVLVSLCRFGFWNSDKIKLNTPPKYM